MISRTPPAVIVLFMLAFMPMARAESEGAASARKSITDAYAKMDAALLGKDADKWVSFLSPGFRGPGREPTREDIKRQLKSLFQIANPTVSKTTIRSIKVNGIRAICRSDSHFEYKVTLSRAQLKSSGWTDHDLKKLGRKKPYMIRHFQDEDMWEKRGADWQLVHKDRNGELKDNISTVR